MSHIQTERCVNRNNRQLYENHSTPFIRMLKTIIIDDEPAARELIRDMLHDNAFAEIVGEAEGVADGYALIESLAPDLVLLDIRLRDGSGFELLRKYARINFKLIIVTAYEKYALDAIKFSALDYLLKPFAAQDLESAIKKAYETNEESNLSLKLNAFFSNFNYKTGLNPQKIVLQTPSSVYLLSINDIIRCEAENRQTRFHMRSNSSLLIEAPFKRYCELLIPHGFIRVHPQHLINRMHAKALTNKTGHAYLVMKDKSIIPLTAAGEKELTESLALK